MTATLHVHRGFASPERVLLLGVKELGPLTDEVTSFEIPPGKHVVSLRLGWYHSAPHLVVVDDGKEAHLAVEIDDETPAPILQGGFVKLVDVPKGAEATA